MNNMKYLKNMFSIKMDMNYILKYYQNMLLEDINIRIVHYMHKENMDMYYNNQFHINTFH